MLIVMIGEQEYFDDSTQRFVFSGGIPLKLEHSLVSLSKWESKFEKPFLSTVEKTAEETLAYVEAMVVDQNVPPEIFEKLSDSNVLAINNYIGAKMTATWFSENPNQPRNREIITAELIYYMMLQHNIPFECENWHLNRLITLIRVCNEKASPKKMSQQELAQRHRELNRKRREELGTSG